MFGKSNIDFRLDVHNERLNFLEGLVTRQEREIALLRQKKETEEPKNGAGFYEALSVCCDFPQPARWTVLADKCEKLQEENSKLKEELAEAKLKNKSLETSLNESYDTIEAACRTANKLREENKKLSREVEALESRVELEKGRSKMLQRNINILMSGTW